MKKSFMFTGLVVVLSMICLVNFSHAADQGTKEEAVAMVKKAIEYMKVNGNEKAFVDITDKTGQFVDRDLYVVVYDMN